VFDKIAQPEGKFRRVHEFATSETWAGIEELKGRETFEDQMLLSPAAGTSLTFSPS